MSIVAAPDGGDDDFSFDDLSWDELMTPQQFAKKLKVSLRTLWRLVSSGKVPKPIKLNGSTRWIKSVVITWFKAGCPPQAGNE